MSYSKEKIKQEIYEYIKGNWNEWYIRITDDPEKRKTEHENPTHWVQWHVMTDKEAREVEAYFVNNYHINGDKGGGEDCHYVYIFKI